MPRPNYDAMITSKEELGIIMKCVRLIAKMHIQIYDENKEKQPYHLSSEFYQVHEAYRKIVEAYNEYASWGVDLYWENDDKIVEKMEKIEHEVISRNMLDRVYGDKK